MKNNKEGKGSKCFIWRPFTFFQYQICLTAEKLYGGLPYQEAYTEQRGNPDVLCGG